ncbi:MAG TPA: 6,7-dimethyl-8-ribityllumazine synthase [Gammaproteobacteria bacterium]|jgi:6,7-dimethyl-8-ribityllumazine synthase|nr:6,7-dimethyl-8-ribityllumazine synthase [Gammaproteobacteria bacterium]
MPGTHRTIEGGRSAKGLRIAIVAARFNHFVVDKLVAGALQTLTEAGISAQDLDVVRVPGAFEIPLAARKLALSNSYEAVICLGAVIRGGTPHFDYVAGECARGVSEAARDSGLPVVFGVLTCDDLEQATERAGGKHGNKGADAALAAIEMADLLRKLEG